MSKKETTELENDFGFSFSEQDTQELEETHRKDVDDLSGRLDRLHEMVSVFLDNLAANPEKKTIVWPNRAEKIEQFKAKLLAIKEGKQ